MKGLLSLLHYLFFSFVYYCLLLYYYIIVIFILGKNYSGFEKKIYLYTVIRNKSMGILIAKRTESVYTHIFKKLFFWSTLSKRGFILFRLQNHTKISDIEVSYLSKYSEFDSTP